MEEIALIGSFSKADACEKGETDKPNLYKQIKKLIKDNQFELSYIFLFVEDKYDIKEQVEKYKEDIVENDADLNKIQKQKIKDVIEKAVEFSEDTDILKKKHVYYMVSSKDNADNIQWFYDGYFAFVEKLRCNNVCLNMVSGNIQSRTSLHMIPMSFPNIKFISYSNQREEGEHRTNSDALAYMEGDLKLHDESEIPGYCSRIRFSNMNYIQNKIYIHTFNSYVKNKDYHEAYFYLEKNKSLFKKIDNKKTDLFIKCFEEKRKLLFHKDVNKDYYYVTQEEVADYFLQRLIYLRSIPNEKKLTYSSMSALQDLIYTIFHIEEGNKLTEIPDHKIKKDENRYILKDEGFIYSIGCFYEFREKDKKIDNGKLEKNPFSISEIDRFIKAFNLKRHAKETDKPGNKEIEFTDKGFELIVDKLKDKFNKEYFSLSSKKQKFDDLYNEISNLQYPIPNKNENNVESYKFTNIKSESKCCILSMMGSTDPGTIWKKNDQEYFMYGSNLAFYKELQKDGNPLKLHLEQNEIPHYLIVTKEIAETFENNNAALDQLKKIYGNQNIHLIPFDSYAEAADFIEAWDCLSNKKSDYSIEHCFEAMENLMSSKINEFDDVFVILSSGIPHAKISWYFLSVFHPAKIHLVEVIGPKIKYKGLEKGEEKNKRDEGKNKNVDNKEIKSINYPDILVRQNLVPIKLDLLYKQKISFETFDSPEMVQVEGYEDVKTIFEEEFENVSDRDQQVIMNLIRLHYVETDIQGFDYCLETVFYECQEMLKGKENLNVFFKSWNVKNLSVEVQKEIEGKLTDSNLKENIYGRLSTTGHKTNRFYGIVCGILYKTYVDKEITWGDLNKINDFWDMISKDKHKQQSKVVYKNDDNIKLILKFNRKLKEKYDKKAKIFDDFKKKVLAKYSLYC